MKKTIREINGRFTCTRCGYEWSAMLGDNEIPEFCECQIKNREIEDFDPVAAKLIDSIPKNVSQAQYSTQDQVNVLLELARKLKLYDAYDLIKRITRVDQGERC